MNAEKYLDFFFNAGNPIFYSIFFTVIILLIFYVVHKYIVTPRQLQHTNELRESELKNARLMALFSELNPSPLIRIDKEGIIIQTNEVTAVLGKSLEGKNIRELLPEINFSVKEYIENERTINLFHRINERYYSIVFKGISSLKIAQLYFNDLTERITFEEKLKYSQEQLKRLMFKQQDVIEEEKHRLARELHDGICQDLVFLKMDLVNSQDKHRKNFGEEYYDHLVNSFEGMIKELRAILNDLKPRVLEELGLETAINKLSEKIARENKIKRQVNIIGLDDRIDDKLEVTIFRIIQESLSNIVKHSGAKEFDISLISENGNIRLLISDDGTGFDEQSNNINNFQEGFGLKNIKERVENLGGSFKIETAQNEGTLLLIELPIKEKVYVP